MMCTTALLKYALIARWLLFHCVCLLLVRSFFVVEAAVITYNKRLQIANFLCSPTGANNVFDRMTVCV